MKKILLLVTGFAFLLINCNQAQSGGNMLSVNDFQTKLQAAPDAQIVDVRTPAEFRKNHLQGAMNLDIRGAEFTRQVAALDKNRPVFVYCLSGGRSASAVAYLKDQGFATVYDMDGGMMKWQSANKPYEQAGSAAAGMTQEAYLQQTRTSKVVLVDFNAPWCAPCRKMAPDLEALAQQYGPNGFTLIKIDVDANPAVAQAQKVDALPTLMLYKDGQVVWNHTGYVEKSVVEGPVKEAVN